MFARQRNGFASHHALSIEHQTCRYYTSNYHGVAPVALRINEGFTRNEGSVRGQEINIDHEKIGWTGWAVCRSGKYDSCIVTSADGFVGSWVVDQRLFVLQLAGEALVGGQVNVEVLFDSAWPCV